MTLISYSLAYGRIAESVIKSLPELDFDVPKGFKFSVDGKHVFKQGPSGKRRWMRSTPQEEAEFKRTAGISPSGTKVADISRVKEQKQGKGQKKVEAQKQISNQPSIKNAPLPASAPVAKEKPSKFKEDREPRESSSEKTQFSRYKLFGAPGQKNVGKFDLLNFLYISPKASKIVSAFSTAVWKENNTYLASAGKKPKEKFNYRAVPKKFRMHSDDVFKEIYHDCDIALRNFWEEKYESIKSETGAAVKRYEIRDKIELVLAGAALKPPSVDDLIYNSLEEIKARLSNYDPSKGTLSEFYTPPFYNYDLERAITYVDPDDGETHNFGQEYQNKIKPAMKSVFTYNDSVKNPADKLTIQTPDEKFGQIINSFRYQFFIDQRTPSDKNDGKSNTGGKLKEWEVLKGENKPILTVAGWDVNSVKRLFTPEFFASHKNDIMQHLGGKTVRRVLFTPWTAGGKRMTLLAKNCSLDKNTRDALSDIFAPISDSSMEAEQFENIAGVVDDSEEIDRKMTELSDSDRKELDGIADLDLRVVSDVKKGLKMLTNPKVSHVVSSLGVKPEQISYVGKVYQILNSFKGSPKANPKELQEQFKKAGVQMQSYIKYSADRDSVVSALNSLQEILRGSEETMEMDMSKSQPSEENVKTALKQEFFDKLPKSKAYRKLMAKIFAGRLENLKNKFRRY